MLPNILSLVILSAAALIFLAGIILTMVFLGKWISNDARERGMDNPVLWVLVVLLVPNMIGLVIYLVIRSSHGKKNPCPECGYLVPEANGYCPRCGVQQPPISQTEIAKAPSKAKKNMKRFLIALGVTVLMSIVLIVISVVGYSTVKVGDNTIISNHSASTVEWGKNHEFHQKWHRSGNDKAELTFASFKGAYELISFRTDGGELTFRLSADSEGEPLSFILKDSDGNKSDLPIGESSHSLAAGRYSVWIQSEGCRDGDIRLTIAWTNSMSSRYTVLVGSCINHQSFVYECIPTQASARYPAIFAAYA